MEKSKIQLTASELGNLWFSYMNDTMTVCVLTHFLETVEDEQIRDLLSFANELSQRRVTALKAIFEKEQVPIPYGFSESDVNQGAPRLYSDTFYLHYVNAYSSMELGIYGRGLGMSARQDVREYFTECVIALTEQFNRSAELLLEKGLFVRPPYISTPRNVKFVEKKSYLAGLFSEPRTLNTIEISTLWSNIMANTLGKALVMGFSQVANSKECREFFVRGRDISQKHLQIFSATLQREHIPSPITWDSDVKNSTTPPFSDKLMMFHTVGLISTGLGNYGASMSSTQRRDLFFTYARLMAEVGEYADDGAKLMIDHGWMEAPPQAEDRDELAGMK